MAARALSLVLFLVCLKSLALEGIGQYLTLLSGEGKPEKVIKRPIPEIYFERYTLGKRIVWKRIIQGEKREILQRSDKKNDLKSPPLKRYLWWCNLENIAKGTTDPRVEFISQLQIQILIKFHFKNLDQASTSKSQPNIGLSIKLVQTYVASEYQPRFNFMTSTKHQQKKLQLQILPELQLQNLDQTYHQNIDQDSTS